MEAHKAEVVRFPVRQRLHKRWVRLSVLELLAVVEGTAMGPYLDLY